MIIVILDRLIEIERKHKMLGIILGIVILITCFTLSILTIKFLLQLNFNILAWVCENCWGFKLY